MVRLFVPEGEGQHPLTRPHPRTVPAQPEIISAPWRASIAAAGFTGFLALCGRSRPGTFLKSAAFLGVVDLSWTVAGLYGRQELNRGVFTMDKIEPKPSKLWESTKHWTTEDAALGGGAMGIFMAMGPRSLPGVYGLTRFLGAATVGCALGFKAGQAFLVRIPPQLLTLLDEADTMTRHHEYERLLQKEEAKASLSRVGKLALSYQTSPYMRILRSPLQVGGMGGLTARQHHHSHDAPHVHGSLAARVAEMDQYTVVQVEFKQGELSGPDIEQGYRAYKDELQTRDSTSLQEWLERTQHLKQKTASEMQYVWQYLGEREQAFYQLVHEDREKDIVRRELQLLNNMASDLVTRCAILGYHESDAVKRLQQIEAKDSDSATAIASYETPRHGIETEQMDNYGPRVVTEQIRTTWSIQKQVVSDIERSLSYYEALQPGESTLDAERRKQLRQNAESMRRNVEATERLLNHFEQQVREADEQVKK
ncbi:hypothetical protein EJ02DRAFT_428599 [Clathrospora elynae]|uniref:Uncharacterized protein n=1 Tax=Clathrospora elynae TaxID=706981 RepID=A0A6A5S6Y7_9PLEO|nr:hypothetical protein EJ02DRAFT_428599 [Clathrospora elynae]